MYFSVGFLVSSGRLRDPLANPGQAGQVMGRLIEVHGEPEAQRLDHGRELTSNALQDWARELGIALRFIEPGEPNQNACIERFNKTYRGEVPSAYPFESIEQVRQITDNWLTATTNCGLKTPAGECRR